MKRVLILESAWCEQEILYRLVRRASCKTEVYRCDCMEAALDMIQTEQVDLFVVAVSLGQEDYRMTEGLRFGKKIREQEEYFDTPMIFIAKDNKYEMYAYRHLHCYQYLESPYDREYMYQNLVEILSHQGKYPVEPTIALSYRSGMSIFHEREIMYLESVNGDILVHTLDDTVSVADVAIKRLLSLLNPSVFFQCHRSFIVNIHYIKKLNRQNNTLVMFHSKEAVPIGKTYKNQLVARLRQF